MQATRYQMDEPAILVSLTDAEIALLAEALDSHEYWQLSEPHQRNDGYSTIEDGRNDEVDAVRALLAKLEGYSRQLNAASAS